MTDERPFPHDLQAERAVLGACMLDDWSIGELEDLGVQPGDFYRPDHGALYLAMLRAWRKGQPVDLVTIGDIVERDSSGHDLDLEYTIQLADHCVSTANVRHYGSIITDRAMRRRALLRLDGLKASLHDLDRDAPDLVSEVVGGLMAGDAPGANGWARADEVAVDRVRELTEQRETGTPHTSTGFGVMDGFLGGLYPEDLVVLAGRPGMGKTALALQLAANTARRGLGVGVFSLEMSRKQLIDRIIAADGLVLASRLRNGGLTDDDLKRMAGARDRLAGVPLYIDDRTDQTISGVVGRARRLATIDPSLTLIVVDYLQLMKGDDPRIPREQQVAAISRGLKGLAKDLGVTVIAVAQLNRGVEERRDKRPILSDLRESGAIEQDADVVLFAFRPEYYWPDDEKRRGTAEIIVAKHRFGTADDIPMSFQGHYARFGEPTQMQLNAFQRDGRPTSHTEPEQ
jgi:replicative DNA helicase